MSKFAVGLTVPRARTDCPLAGRETAEVARRLADELSARIFAMGVGRGVVRCDLEQIVAAGGAPDAAERYLPLRTLADAPW